MTYVQSFSAVIPPPRYDEVAWTDLEVWESEAEDGTYVLIDDQAIALDATPESPNPVTYTTTVAEFPEAWYRFRFKDETPSYSNFSDPVLAPADNGYFTVAELRAKYPALTLEKYSDAVVAAAIARAIETIEQACDVAFTPRERTTTVPASSDMLSLPNNRVREVTAVTGSIYGEVSLTDAYLVAGSYFRGTSAWPSRETLTVTYTHGHDEPPLRIRDAAMLYARSLVIDGPVDKRATQMPAADGGVINLLTPGMFGSVTGIPEVDAAIEQYSERVGVA